MVITEEYKAALKAALNNQQLFPDARLRDGLVALFPAELKTYADIQTLYAQAQVLLWQWQNRQVPHANLLQRFATLIDNKKVVSKVTTNQKLNDASVQRVKKIAYVKVLFAMGIVALSVLTLVGGLLLWLAFRKHVTKQNKTRPDLNELIKDVQQHSEQQVELKLSELKKCESLLTTKRNENDVTQFLSKDTAKHIFSLLQPKEFRALRLASRFFKHASDELVKQVPYAYMRPVVPKILHTEFVRESDVVKIDDRHQLLHKPDNTCVIRRDGRDEYLLGDSNNIEYEVTLLKTGHFAILRHAKKAKLWYFQADSADLKEQDSLEFALEAEGRSSMVPTQVYLESNLQHLLVITSPVIHEFKRQPMYIQVPLNTASEVLIEAQAIKPDQLDHTKQYWQNNQLHSWNSIEFSYTMRTGPSIFGPHAPSPRAEKHFFLDSNPQSVHRKLTTVIPLPVGVVIPTNRGVLFASNQSLMRTDNETKVTQDYFPNIHFVSYNNEEPINFAYREWTACALSKDRKILAIGETDAPETATKRVVQLFDLNEGKVLLKIPEPVFLSTHYQTHNLSFTDQGSLLNVDEDKGKTYKFDFLQRKQTAQQQSVVELLEEDDVATKMTP